MKEKIHPTYGATTIQCACGNVIETQSTVQGVIRVDICSSCHPFFTGQQKLLDTAGRIDRFKKKFGEKMVLGTQKRQNFEPSPAPVKKTPAEKKASLKDAKNPNQEKLEQAKEKLTKKV